MAALRLCSIPDCGKPARKRGWCQAHYMRWYNNGSPTAGKTSPGELPRYLTNTVFVYRGDDCLIWPYARNKWGYGKVTIGGRTKGVHRLVCEYTHGPPPTVEHQACHSCGNGHLGCVAPNHLSWKTRKGNAADAIAHGVQIKGERHHMARLSALDVAQIRSLRGVIPQSEIAKRFGIRQNQVSRIQLGRSWAD